MYSVMIVGCGKIAGINNENSKFSHGGAILSNEKLKLKACVDHNQINSDDFANKFKCKSYNDLNEALSNEKTNIVSICTPDETHFDITKKVLSSKNKPDLIFLEKPPCQNLNQYYSLVKLSNKRKVPIIVNFSRRFNSDVSIIKDLIAKRNLGKIIRIEAIYYNGWMHNGIHAVDTILYLLNENIVLKKVKNINFCSYFRDKTFDVFGETDISKAPIGIKAVDERYYQLFEIDLWFSNARLKFEDFGSSIKLEVPKVNNLKERVLEREKIIFPERKYTNIEIAYNNISSALDLDDFSKLENFTLQNSESTMRTINEGMELFINK